MPSNINPTRIKNTDLLNLYINVGLAWEHYFRLEKKGYRLKSKQMTSFMQTDGLELINVKGKKSVIEEAKKRHMLNEGYKSNYFVYKSHTSLAYDLFRHLRNSVAHGNINKKKKGRYNYLLFKDTYRGNTTMVGQVRLIALSRFIRALHSTK